MGIQFVEGVKEVKYVGNMLCCSLYMNVSCCNLKMSSILNVYAVLNNGSVCSLYLLPVIILNAFFVIYRFSHKHNPIVT